jgi:hypothetical protein
MEKINIPEQILATSFKAALMDQGREIRRRKCRNRHVIGLCTIGVFVAIMDAEMGVRGNAMATETAVWGVVILR